MHGARDGPYIEDSYLTSSDQINAAVMRALVLLGRQETAAEMFIERIAAEPELHGWRESSLECVLAFVKAKRFGDAIGVMDSVDLNSFTEDDFVIVANKFVENGRWDYVLDTWAMASDCERLTENLSLLALETVTRSKKTPRPDQRGGILKSQFEMITEKMDSVLGLKKKRMGEITLISFDKTARGRKAHRHALGAGLHEEERPRERRQDLPCHQKCERFRRRHDAVHDRAQRRPRPAPRLVSGRTATGRRAGSPGGGTGAAGGGTGGGGASRQDGGAGRVRNGPGCGQELLLEGGLCAACPESEYVCDRVRTDVIGKVWEGRSVTQVLPARNICSEIRR